jgi:hypothetical protein
MIKRIDWRGQNKQHAVTRNPNPIPYAIIDFPPNPNIGDQFVAPNGATYEWDGAVWVGIVPVISGGVIVPIDSNPPIGAVSGALWWRNDDAVLYILYDDGTSTQWVPAQPPGGGAAGIEDAPSDGNMYIRQNGAWVLLPP